MTKQHSPSKENFGQRLHRARLMRGLTLRKVAELLDKAGVALSHAALQKYEKGLMGPNSTVLLALCRIFNLEAGYFFRQQSVTLNNIEFRKLVKFPAQEVNRVREEAADYFEKYLQIENILEIKAPLLPRVNLSHLEASQKKELAEEAEEAAIFIREKWNLGEVALNNVHELLEEWGVKVKEVKAEESFNGFSGWADQHTPVIVLADWLNHDLPRKRLTALHELGHLVLILPKGVDKKLKESLCYRFAGALLLPASVLRARLGLKRPNGISLPEKLGIKKDWGISIGALMRRAADLEIITGAELKKFYYFNSKDRKKEAGKWEGTENADRFDQLVYRAVSQEVITRAKAAELLEVTLRQLDQQYNDEAA